MSSSREHELAEFLRGVLEELLALPDGTIQVGYIEPYIPESVFAEFSKRKTSKTNSDEILKMCLSAGVITQAFDRAVERLIEVWNDVKADRKRNLIADITNHRFLDQFPSYMHNLSPRDQEALRIRWDAADFLFSQHRADILGSLRKNSKGEPNLIGMGEWKNAFDLLIGLLRSKADFDVSAVNLAVGDQVSRYLSMIVGRNTTEYFSYIDLLRSEFTEWLLDIYPQEYGPGRKNPVRDVEATLDPFKKRFEEHTVRITASIANAEILKSVAQFIQRHPLPQPKEVIQVRTINTEGGDYVEKPNQYTKSGNTYNLNGAANELLASADLNQLAAQPREVIAKAAPQAKTGDRLKALAELSDAANAAEKQDTKTVGQKIGSVAKESLLWIKDVAVELSASIVAKIAEAHLGLPG
jgi:hypothetical protein